MFGIDNTPLTLTAHNSLDIRQCFSKVFPSNDEQTFHTINTNAIFRNLCTELPRDHDYILKCGKPPESIKQRTIEG